MGKREELHSVFTAIIGSNSVYYQPPATISMTYPAIEYHREDIINRFADDSVYFQLTSYAVTVIDPNPDSDIVKAISKLPRCRFDRHFTSDNLNHDVFIIYY